MLMLLLSESLPDSSEESLEQVRDVIDQTISIVRDVSAEDIAKVCNIRVQSLISCSVLKSINSL